MSGRPFPFGRSCFPFPWTPSASRVFFGDVPTPPFLPYVTSRLPFPSFYHRSDRFSTLLSSRFNIKLSPSLSSQTRRKVPPLRTSISVPLFSFPSLFLTTPRPPLGILGAISETPSAFILVQKPPPPHEPIGRFRFPPSPIKG